MNFNEFVEEVALWPPDIFAVDVDEQNYCVEVRVVQTMFRQPVVIFNESRNVPFNKLTLNRGELSANDIPLKMKVWHVHTIDIAVM